MLTKFLTKVFGSRNDRLVKRYRKTVQKINAFEEDLQALSDEQLRAKTDEFKLALSQKETDLAQILPEAFAIVRDMSRRITGMRHFDVQLIGGMVLNDGKIAEMRTGEGKTLVATLPVYLNALTGKGVHVVTVNDYLARRDAAWMGKLYHALGLTIGVINGSGGQGPDAGSYQYDPEYIEEQEGIASLRPVTRREAYACDIVYGTNNEYGFDYLRDNMAFAPEQRVQRDLAFAVVDEVDSILIDEARTPLIISGPTNDATDLYVSVNQLIPALQRQEEEDGEGDYTIDEKAKQAYLSEQGHDRVEAMLEEQGLLGEGESLYDPMHIALMHHLNAALRAHTLFHRDVDYLVQNNQIVIIDEFTGRTMAGRRWSDGLHQAIEAKEGVAIQNENQTLASITFQNYFRLYDKLSGMTGTADTEAFEFQQIYGLEVVVIPTHRPIRRDDMDDLIYLTAAEKFNAIIEDIKYCVKEKRPVLVGTASVETSEYLSGLLKKSGIQHEVLNAKQHGREANIVEQAGQASAVTIATNMAGRGTDIVLGGSLDADLKAAGDTVDADKIRADWQQRHDAVLEAGGLHIIGTERHESRRIDNQLRGRSGRQGDPGSTRFYLSLEDNLMRVFASERMKSMMQGLGMSEGEAIEHRWVTKAITNAQRKVEAHNFDMRKNLLEYDDVANDQRKVIYGQREELLEADDVQENVIALREDVIDFVISEFIAPGSVDEMWDVAGLEAKLQMDFGQSLTIQQWLDEDEQLHEESLRDRIQNEFSKIAEDKERSYGSELMRRLEKDVMLNFLDSLWKEHLASMDYLRQSIGLRGYAQKNPKQEYKREAFEMFSEMLSRITYEVTRFLAQVQLQSDTDVESLEAQQRKEQQMNYAHPKADSAYTDEEAEANENQTYRRDQPKLGRNDPCYCGSGKKFKHCHGKLS